jgi:LuxR family maltose regulon positive regulatory protein
MPVTILATKLYIPPPQPKIVLRPHLVERLNEGLHRKLILISASAGFGKTTLVSEWVASYELLEPKVRTAWLSLDEGDNDPTRFLSCLVAALQTIRSDIGEGVLIALQSPQPPQSETILTTLINEITSLPESFILVLDDYHVIEAKLVENSLTFLLEHLPPQMHMVIATREDPPLPLARLRARSQLTELRAADLRFTPSEAAEFLNQVMGLNLSSEDITALENRTEGWIAGLQMAALALQGLASQRPLSMHGHPDASSFIKSFTGSHHFVLDYLVEEVLQQQPDSVQNFLLRTSILDRMCGSLCEAVLCTPAASGQETLEYLERANLFIVPLDSERRWYRYHHLFGDLLHQRLAQSLAPRAIAQDHIHASEWYENNGLLFEAFRHATAANDIERTARLVQSKEMPLYFRYISTAVLDWLASLPPPVLDARPSLRVMSATLALMAGQTTGVEERLQAAEKVLQNADLDDRTRDLIGRIACARATLALTHYQPEAMITQSGRALEYLHPDNLTFRFTANWTLANAYLLQGDRSAAAQASLEGIAISQKAGDVFSTILATSTLGEVQELENQLYQAAETYRHVLQLFGDHPQPNACEVHLGLARISYEWNDLDAAEQHGQQSLQLARQYDSVIDRFIISEVFLARLKLAQGDVAGAAAILAQADASARQQSFVHRMPEIAAAQVLVLLHQGNLEAAKQLAQKYELPLSRARVLLAQGDPSAALAVLEPLCQQMEARGWQDERLRVMVLQAVALYVLALQERREKDRAMQVLGEALALAEPGGFIRLFVDEDAPMAQLLSIAAAQGMMADYIGKLRAAFEAEAQTGEDKFNPPPAQPLIEPLSQRELEILQLIAQGLSNHEIGERLFLALDTVKGHNRRIFDKLQVHRRTEAVARARVLGLL